MNTDAGKRAVRTGTQGGAAWAILEVIQAFELYEFTPRQLQITMVVGTAIVSFIQNQIENRLGKAFLKNVPEEPMAAETPPEAPAPPKKAAPRKKAASKKP